jgi:hypothetical protein
VTRPDECAVAYPPYCLSLNLSPGGVLRSALWAGSASTIQLAVVARRHPCRTSSHPVFPTAVSMFGFTVVKVASLPCYLPLRNHYRKPDRCLLHHPVRRRCAGRVAASGYHRAGYPACTSLPGQGDPLIPVLRMLFLRANLLSAWVNREPVWC